MEPQKPEMENELKPKVRALYEAVLELLNENADISTMKVSDITSRAGIGKGTAYDYFKSKEEIIACAVMYDARRQGMETREKLRELPDFQARIRYCFHWVEECVREQKAFGKLLFFTHHPGGVPEEVVVKMKQIYEQNKSGCVLEPVEILSDLCGRGKAEGYIREEISPEDAAYILLGNLCSLFMYMGQEKGVNAQKCEKLREFLCEGFLKTVK